MRDGRGIGRIAASVIAVVVALWPAAAVRAAEGPVVATCPTSLPAAQAGGKPAAFLSLALMVGSPEGKFGTIAQSRSEFDASGKHGRDFFPIAGEADVFLACHYVGDQMRTIALPPGIRLCEVDYTYINDYDTRADRIFCR